MSNVAYKTGVDVVSTSLERMGAGLVIGDVRRESGKEYMFCLSGGTIPSGYVATPGIAATATASALIMLVTPADDEAWCVNNTGSSIATGTYFWGLVNGEGYGYIDTTAAGGGVTGGIAVCVEGTAGELMERTNGLNCGVALATILKDVTGAVYFDFTKHNFIMQA